MTENNLIAQYFTLQWQVCSINRNIRVPKDIYTRIYGSISRWREEIPCLINICLLKQLKLQTQQIFWRRRAQHKKWKVWCCEKQMSSQTCLVLMATFNSPLSPEFHVFFIRSVQLVLNDGWRAWIWITEMGRTRGELVTPALHLVGQHGSQGDSLVWSALTGLWLRQENAGGWNLQGNQWTETDECLQWHLLSIYGQKQNCWVHVSL